LIGLKSGFLNGVAAADLLAKVSAAMQLETAPKPLPTIESNPSSQILGSGAPERHSRLLSGLINSLWRRMHPVWATPRPGVEHPQFRFGLRSLVRYCYDRIANSVAARRRREVAPWLPDEAIRHLDTLLRPTDVVLEFGSGASTEWFARRVALVYSVEATEEWYLRTGERLRDQGLANVELVLAPVDELESAAHMQAYAYAHPHLEEGSVDVVLVDGSFRDETALRSLRLLRSGGLLVLDNANTYLPTRTRSPGKVLNPATDKWRRFIAEVATWRSAVTTNGLQDTVIWVKP
jgi:predicted O-methyltransferase YrrM